MKVSDEFSDMTSSQRRGDPSPVFYRHLSLVQNSQNSEQKCRSSHHKLMKGPLVIYRISRLASSRNDVFSTDKGQVLQVVRLTNSE